MAIIAIKVHMSAAAFVLGPVFLSYPVIHELEKRKGGGGEGCTGGCTGKKKTKKTPRKAVWLVCGSLWIFGLIQNTAAK